MKTNNYSFRLFISLLLALLVAAVVLQIPGQVDLTSDKRYTLSDVAKEMIRPVNETIYITVFLEGNLPNSFRNYKSYLDYYISELRRFNNRIEIFYKNPNEGSFEEVQSLRSFFAEQGVEPIRRQVRSSEEINESLLYPYFSIHNSNKIVFVNLLEPQVQGISEEENLLISQLAFEQKFLKGIRSLLLEKESKVHVLGERSDLIAEGLNRSTELTSYSFESSGAASILRKMDSISAILVVLKEQDLKRKELLATDIASLNGIPVIWLIDKFPVHLDSLSATGSHLAFPNEFLSEDFLFSMGVKIEAALLQDLQCSQIPQVVGGQGSQARTELLPYPYHPVFIWKEGQSTISRVNAPAGFYYVAPIELLEYPESINKQALLLSSEYSKLNQSPIPLDFSNMAVEPEPGQYANGSQIFGARVKGETKPYFQNRLLESDVSFLKTLGISYPSATSRVDHIIVSDADFILPSSDKRGRFFPIGFNQFEGYLFEGNLQLLDNYLESMVYGDRFFDLSDRKTSIAVLDSTSYEQSRSFYLLLSLALPLVLLLLMYFIVHFLRKQRYGKIH